MRHRYHGFDIGTHDRPDPRFLRILPELIRRTFAMSNPFAQPLYGNVNVNLVAIAETVLLLSQHRFYNTGGSRSSCANGNRVSGIHSARFRRTLLL
jgi:hypothetical protein